MWLGVLVVVMMMVKTRSTFCDSSACECLVLERVWVERLCVERSQEKFKWRDIRSNGQRESARLRLVGG